MIKPKDVLSTADYTNYRNVRAVSVLFVLFGGLLIFAGIGLALIDPRNQTQIHPAVGVSVAVAGLAVVVGGIAVLRGNRRWAPLVYLLATICVFVFPIGTILSLVLFKGLSRYLNSMQRVRAATVKGAESRAVAGQARA